MNNYMKKNNQHQPTNKINGKTMEEVLGKDWKEKFNNLKGDEIYKERDRLKRLIDEERIEEILKEKLAENEKQ